MEGSIREQDFSIYLKSYYLMELAFYTSVLFSLFIDAKRKDFYQQFLHHIVTILLVLTLYAIVQFRVKTVIIFCMILQIIGWKQLKCLIMRKNIRYVTTCLFFCIGFFLVSMDLLPFLGFTLPHFL